MHTPPTLQGLFDRLRPYKGQFQLRSGQVRHKTRRVKGAPSCPACPLYVLAEDLGFAPTHHGDANTFAMAAGCNKGLAEQFMNAADGGTPFQRDLVEAVV